VGTVADALDLDALVQQARVEAAAQRSDHAAEAEVLALLAERGGSLPLADLLAAGAPTEVVARLVDPNASNDKRRKTRARLGVVAEAPVVWLTATGWQATGRSSGREQVPTADSVSHATTPGRVADWLTAQAPAWEDRGVFVRITWGASCRRWSEEVVARAWGRLRSLGDTEGAVGSLTGGLVPDALLVERWTGQGALELHAGAWGQSVTAVQPEDLAETTVAVEVEDTRKSAEPLRYKVSRWHEATETLGAARAVVWLVRTREVADRLRDLGVDTEHRPTQLLVPATVFGLDGEALGPVQRPWWAWRVTASLPPSTPPTP
jgi:hypothetical protein